MNCIQKPPPNGDGFLYVKSLLYLQTDVAKVGRHRVDPERRELYFHVGYPGKPESNCVPFWCAPQKISLENFFRIRTVTSARILL
jgi:hypothetical protein